MPHPLRASALFLALHIAAAGSGCLTSPSVDELREFLARAETPENDALVLTFFPTGIGDAILVELPNGTTLLVDAGVGWKADQIIDYVAARQLEKIDVALVTHPHFDHYGGIERIIEKVPVKRFIDNGVDAHSPGVASMNAAIEALSIPRSSLSRGDALTDLSDGTVTIDTLFPEPADRENVQGAFADENDATIVLRLVHGPHRILLTGDAEYEEEARLIDLEGEALRAHVLKLGHHASVGASTEAFLAEVQPKLAVAQGTEIVHIPLVYPRPCTLLRGRLRKIGTVLADTGRIGLVQVVSDSDGLRWTAGKVVGEWRSSSVETTTSPDEVTSSASRRSDAKRS